MRGTRLELFVFVLVVVLLGGVALAQDPISWNPLDWARNPFLAAGALAGFVALVRQKLPVIDGPVRVPVFTHVVGAGAGWLLDRWVPVQVEPFSGMPDAYAGVAYGLALAFFNVTGIAIWNYLTAKLRPVTVSVAALPETSTQNDIVRFILNLVRGLLPLDKVPEGVRAVAGLVAQFAQSEVVLTDDLRAELQGKVLSLLRKAGLVGADL